MWDTIKEAREGTEDVKERNIDLSQGEIEHFVMRGDEAVRQMFDRIVVLVSNIGSLGSTDWDDRKVSKEVAYSFHS